MATPARAPVPRSSPRFQLPPRLETDDGRVRRVGIEIEFAGLDIGQACDLVQRVFGGTIESVRRFGSTVRGTRHGDFGVEIDSQPLKQERYKKYLERIGAGATLTGVVEDALESIASMWIPAEIVSAPIPIGDLQDMEELRWALHEQAAEGTKASILYTFGFQLNPELPGLDAPTITRYLRAFLVLQSWLFAVVQPDLTRDLAGWMEPFPEPYRRRVIDPAYAPDLDALIGDYLEANPTRNRACDMLPLFASLQAERVIAAAREHEQIKPRPTFHYRLPNCLVDDPTWSFALEWNRWVEVERLAEDPARLERAGAMVLATPEGTTLDRGALIDRAQGWGVEAP